MSSETRPTAAEANPTSAPVTDSTPAPAYEGNATAHEGERHHQGHDLPPHGHNISTQPGVRPNEDLALHYSHEHQHDHMHHASTSLAGRHDDILYARGTTEDQHITPQNHAHTVEHHRKGSAHVGVDSKDHSYSETDAEKGDVGVETAYVGTTETEDGRKHRF